MKIDSQEKNLIRRLHRKYSVINEVTTGGTAPDVWGCMGSQAPNPGCNGPHPAGTFNMGQTNLLSIHTNGTDCLHSCQPGFKWRCNLGTNQYNSPAGCVQAPPTIYPTYNSLSQCEQSGCESGDVKYNCVNNSCTSVSQTDPGYSSAPFLTMDECQDSMCGERRGPINPRGPKTTIPVNNTYAKKGNVKTNLREEVSRAKLMWCYNTNLTLNENTKQTNEQTPPIGFSGNASGTMPPTTGGAAWNGMSWFTSMAQTVYNKSTNQGQQVVCDWLLQKYNTIYAKASNFGDGGQNPLWQNQIAYKLMAFYFFLTSEVCDTSTINEQDYGVKQPPQWCYDALKPGQLSEIQNGVRELVTRLAETTRAKKELDQPETGNIREQDGPYRGDAGAWNENPMAFMMWAWDMTSKINNHPNPCNFIGKRKSHFETKKGSNNPNSNSPKGPEWQQMIQTKIDFFQQKENNHDNDDGTTGCP